MEVSIGQDKAPGVVGTYALHTSHLHKLLSMQCNPVNLSAE